MMTTGEKQFNTVSVQMSDIEAERFVEFQRYYDKIKVILDSKILELRNGRAYLDFDINNRLVSIDAHVNVFRSGAKSVIGIIVPLAE